MAAGVKTSHAVLRKFMYKFKLNKSENELISGFIEYKGQFCTLPVQAVETLTTFTWTAVI